VLVLPVLMNSPRFFRSSSLMMNPSPQEQSWLLYQVIFFLSLSFSFFLFLFFLSLSIYISSSSSFPDILRRYP
jgi:hypothetical protein